MAHLRLVTADNDPYSRAVAAFVNSKIAAGRSPATVAFYSHTLDRFAPFWPPTPGTCQAFMLRLRRDGLSEHTIASYHRGVRAFLNWCVRRGIIESNPLSELDKPRQPDPTPRAIPRATLTTLFNLMAERARAGDLLAARDHALFRLIYDAGLRASEAARLRVVDLDLDRQAAIVHGKGDKWREVFYGTKTVNALRAWLAVLHPGSEWLFTSADLRRGLRALTRYGIYQALRRWCEAAGVEPFRVHDLRHSYVIHAMRRGIDPRQVSDQAGHSDVSFTLRVYGKSADETRRQSHIHLSPGDEV